MFGNAKQISEMAIGGLVEQWYTVVVVDAYAAKK